MDLGIYLDVLSTPIQEPVKFPKLFEEMKSVKEQGILLPRPELVVVRRVLLVNNVQAILAVILFTHGVIVTAIFDV